MGFGRCLLLLVALWPGALLAQGPSLFRPVASQGTVEAPATSRPGSLFAGKSEAGLFAPWPDRPPAPPDRPDPVPGPAASGGAIAQLRDLIALAEAGPAGYDAVQHGARIRPAKPPTRMRIRDIRAWVAATPGQPHAIGRYQFIPPTFDHLVAQLGIAEDALFSPAVQNRMAEQLLLQAGLARFLRGEMGRVAFMNNLAKIWAGLPNSSGQSHYHGYAGNRAAMTWARFEREMTRIFPASRA